MEEEWSSVLDMIKEEFDLFQHQFVKFKENLPTAKNLAQL